MLWHSQEEIRNLLVEYYTERKNLPGEATGNWRVLPEAARKELDREAAVEAKRQHLQ
ncbi:MAG TPA: hypothetical protein VGH38_28070 [Bryobacteraceae bacterium]